MIPPVCGNLVPVGLAHGPKLEVADDARKQLLHARQVGKALGTQPWASRIHSIPFIPLRATAELDRQSGQNLLTLGIDLPQFRQNFDSAATLRFAVWGLPGDLITQSDDAVCILPGRAQTKRHVPMAR